MSAGVLSKWFVPDVDRTIEAWMITSSGTFYYPQSGMVDSTATWQGPIGTTLTFVADDVRLSITTTSSLTYGRLSVIGAQASNLLPSDPTKQVVWTNLTQSTDQFTFVVNPVKLGADG